MRWYKGFSSPRAAGAGAAGVAMIKSERRKPCGIYRYGLDVNSRCSARGVAERGATHAERVVDSGVCCSA